MITSEEIAYVHRALEKAQALGAQNARANLVKSSENLVSTLDGEIDKVTRCEDRSLSLALFADGRFGSFSTNRLDEESLDRFIAQSVDIVRMLAPDEFRKLPDPGICCKDAISGLECEAYDPSISSIGPEQRCSKALEASVFNSDSRIISEEGEYSDSEYDSYLADTQGLSCRHTETSFDYGVEITVEGKDGDKDGDKDGGKYSAYWWHSSPFAKELELEACGGTALSKALGKIGSEAAPCGIYNMVVESDVASKMVSPILNALNGYSIQQNNSFLKDSLGKQIFPEGLTISDFPRIKGQTGSRYFDSEGVCATDAAIIEKGTVKRYFLNTYMAGKMNMKPTLEEAVRPMVSAWPRKGINRDDIMAMCGNGILVTDFNGGNKNSATGDFSYGVEGYMFEGGKIVRPVSGMLVTGNFLTLWANLIAAGDDARKCMSKLIPTLAFSNVDFSG